MNLISRLLAIVALLSISIGVLHAQVGINNPTPAASSVLDLTSTDKGFLTPRMSTAQRLAITSPATGLLVFDNTLNKFYYYDGIVWRPFSDDSSGWLTTGNTGTNISSNFLGTIDNTPFAIRTNNTEALRVHPNGHVSIGSTTTSAKLYTTVPSSDASTGYSLMSVFDGTYPSSTYSGWFVNSGAGNGEKYAIDSYVTNDGTGQHYGIRTNVGQNSSSSTTSAGFYSVVQGSGGTGMLSGYMNYIYAGSSTSSMIYGISTSISPNQNGTADIYGQYTNIGSSLSSRYGDYKTFSVTSSSGAVYGDYNDIGGSGSILSYGVYNEITNTGSAAKHGVYNRYSGTGNGIFYGTYNEVDNSGTGAKYGSYNELSGTGNGAMYGQYNLINNSGSGGKMGIFNNFSGSSNPNYTGMYNYWAQTGTGTKTGLYNQFTIDAGGVKHGVNNHFQSITSNGTIFGVRNYIFSNNNTSTKYGTYNYLSSNNGTLYGSYNYLSQTASSTYTVYGIYSNISSTGSGTHYAGYFYGYGDSNYGIYASNSHTNGWAGYFIGNTYIDGNTIVNESGVNDHDLRVESDTRTHALWVDADENLVRFGTPSTTSDFSNGTLVAGITADYVADFDIGAASGTTIGIGSVEFLIDGVNETSINNSFTPTDHLIRDLGLNTTTRAWDDVYADNFINVSDRREKSDIQSLTYGLNEVMKMQPVSYTLNRDPFKEKKLGLIAQDILTLVPEAVKTHDHKLINESDTEPTKVELERMGMAYQQLIPVLINAVKELNQKIGEQQLEIDRLNALVGQ